MAAAVGSQAARNRWKKGRAGSSQGAASSWGPHVEKTGLTCELRSMFLASQKDVDPA